MDRVLTVRELTLLVVKKLKLIVIFTLAVTIITGAVGAFIAESHNNAVTSDEALLHEIEAEEAQYNYYLKVVEGMENYMNNSIYFSIDPYSVAESTIFFRVSCPNGGNAQACVNLYNESMLKNTVVTDAVCEVIGSDIDANYIHEILSITPNGGYTLKLTAIHTDSDVAKRIVNVVYPKMYDLVLASAGSHEVRVTGEYTTTQPDETLKDYHREYYESYDSAMNDLRREETVFENLKKKGEPSSVVASVCKYAVIGGLVALVLVVLSVILLSPIGNKLVSATEIPRRYQLEVIGTLPTAKRRLCRKMINSLSGCRQKTREEVYDYLGKYVSSIFADKHIVFVSSNGMTDENTEIIKAITARSSNCTISLCGNILKDSEALKSLSESDCIILLERIDRSLINDIDDEIMRIDSLGMKVNSVIINQK